MSRFTFFGVRVVRSPGGAKRAPNKYISTLAAITALAADESCLPLGARGAT